MMVIIIIIHKSVLIFTTLKLFVTLWKKSNSIFPLYVKCHAGRYSIQKKTILTLAAVVTSSIIFTKLFWLAGHYLKTPLQKISFDRHIFLNIHFISCFFIFDENDDVVDYELIDRMIIRSSHWWRLRVQPNQRKWRSNFESWKMSIRFLCLFGCLTH